MVEIGVYKATAKSSSHPSINRDTYPFSSTYFPVSLSRTPVLTRMTGFRRTPTAHALRSVIRLFAIRFLDSRIASGAVSIPTACPSPLSGQYTTHRKTMRSRIGDFQQ